MCCTLEPATLANTKIYVGEAWHPTEGPVHVVGYQNEAESLVVGPNAMLLPLPTDQKVSPQNVVNGEAFKGLLNEYEAAVERLRPRRRGMRLELNDSDDVYGSRSLAKNFQIFQSGSYTVVLADSSKHLAEGALEVPEDKRPAISKGYAEALEALYPNTPIALCCFNGGAKPEPLFWWYAPRNAELMIAPAIDAHDGRPPVRSAVVSRDHTVAFGSEASDRPEDRALKLYIHSRVPQEHQWMFSAKVCGARVESMTPNGDLSLYTSYVRKVSQGQAYMTSLNVV